MASYICSIDGCEKQGYAKHLCGMHYQRNRVHGDPGPAKYIFPRGVPAEVRFWDAVALDEETGCWLWTRSTKGSVGYGVIFVDGKNRKAHRFAYELLVGPIAEGLTLDHLCRTPACVNPGHLEPVTQAENCMRGEGVPAKNARKTHCSRGHPLVGPAADLKPSKRGHRICRTCANINRMRFYWRSGR